MISISEKSRAAILALTELARRTDDGPVPILDVAQARDIPLHFLEQIFGGLRRAGVLQSQRGVKGGYSFRRAPSDVRVIEVVEIVDGRIGAAPGEESGGKSDWVWAEAAAALRRVLDDLTIADVAEREAQEQSAPMFHI